MQKRVELDTAPKSGNAEPRSAADPVGGTAVAAPSIGMADVRVSPATVSDRQPITVGDLTRLLLTGWWLMLLGTILGFSAATALLRVVPVTYTATMVVGPVVRQGSSPIASASPALGFASRLGINVLPNAAVTDFDKFKTLVTSVRVAEISVERHNLLKRLFADLWDEDTARWVPPDSLVHRMRSEIRMLIGRTQWQPPTPLTLADHFQDTVRFDRIGKTGFVRVSYRHADAELAGKVLQVLYDETETLMKEKNTARTREYIGYLTSRLKEVTMIDQRNALRELLSGSEQALMLLYLDHSFAAEIVDGPVVSDQPTSPRPIIYIVLGSVAGLIVGLLFHMIRSGLLAPRRAASRTSETVPQERAKGD